MLIDDGSVSNTIGGPVAGGRNFISGNAEGVLITGSSTAGTDVAGNLIGTDVEGTAAVGNLTAGIVIAGGTGATIGGTTVLAGNVISGNTGDGIDIGAGAANTLVEGNYIGTDQTGTKPLANSGSGVSVDDASGVTIGGTAQGAGNVISANAQAGVSIAGTATTGVVILGNRIGTDYTGTAALGNGTFGVLVSGTPGVTIGGTATGDGNIISANPTAGIGLYADTTGALIEGNLIGTDVTGSNPLGNGNGIQIDGGSSNNTIGGTAAGAGNTIAFSTGIGVDVDATAGTGNEIRLNSIFSNTGLGIDLGGDGVTLNNSAGHTGPNDYQNFPVITAVTSAGGVTTVTGSLNSTAEHNIRGRFLHALVDQRVGLRRGPVRPRLDVSHDQRDGQRQLRLPVPDPRRRGPVRDGHGHRPGRQHLGILPGVRCRHPADGRHRVHEHHRQRGRPRSRSTAWDRPTPAAIRSPTPGRSATAATATGPEPTHTYTAPGTDTVTLTVNDGFGGISTATGHGHGQRRAAGLHSQLVHAAPDLHDALARRRIW